jgi:Ricin-type beta-trefoil lectin domain-like
VADAAGTIEYTRFEQIIQRWAVNTGFTQGDKTDGADAQTWSWVDPNDSNNQWQAKHVANGYYIYRNRWSDKCLGVETLAASGRVEQQTCKGISLDQLWAPVRQGTLNGRDTYTLENKGLSNKLGVHMVITADHTQFASPLRMQQMMAGNTTQLWYESFVDVPVWPQGRW